MARIEGGPAESSCKLLWVGRGSWSQPAWLVASSHRFFHASPDPCDSSNFHLQAWRRVWSQEPRAAGHIRTECFPVQERHGQLRLAPCSNLILILSMTSSLEHPIILARGTLVVKHPGSNCLYLKGTLRCRLLGFQINKVHWNRASANLQFGFFHSPVLPPLSKMEGFGFWPQNWSFLLSLSNSYICRLWKRILGQFISVSLWQRWFWKNSDMLDRKGGAITTKSFIVTKYYPG